MNFENAYQKFLNGTASPEEIEFVRSEMKKANEINDILTNVKSNGATSVAEEETVKKAMKSYRKKDTLKILLIVGCAMVTLAIAIACAIGIPVLSKAKGNTNYTREQAKEIAVKYVAQRFPEGRENIEVKEIERELEIDGRVKNARYVYVVEVYNGINEVYEIEIDGKTGKILEIDD